MAQTSFGRRRRFCPTRRPLFHGVRKGLLFELISMGMVDLLSRPLHRIALVQRAGRCNATAQTAEPMSRPRTALPVRKLLEVLPKECARSGHCFRAARCQRLEPASLADPVLSDL